MIINLPSQWFWIDITGWLTTNVHWSVVQSMFKKKCCSQNFCLLLYCILEKKAIKLHDKKYLHISLRQVSVQVLLLLQVPPPSMNCDHVSASWNTLFYFLEFYLNREWATIMMKTFGSDTHLLCTCTLWSLLHERDMNWQLQLPLQLSNLEQFETENFSFLQCLNTKRFLF